MKLDKVIFYILIRFYNVINEINIVIYFKIKLIIMSNYSIDFINMFTSANLINSIITFYLYSLFIHKSLHCFYRSPGAKADLGNTCYPYRLFNSELPLLFIRTYNVIRQSTGKPDDWTERESN